MKSVLTRLTIGAAMTATALTAAAPASAQGYYGHRQDNTGTALIAGLAGLAIGAAIVSSSNHRRGDDGYRHYDRRYDGQPTRYGYDGYNRGYQSNNYYRGNDPRGYGYQYDHQRGSYGYDRGEGQGRYGR